MFKRKIYDTLLSWKTESAGKTAALIEGARRVGGLYYYTFRTDNRSHLREVDFLITRGSKICPIEVKSSRIDRHVSLDEFCGKYSARILKKYIIHTKDFSKDKDIICIPIYTCPFL
jgi:predicted AAA+ superfamily ATPase